jgi:hypothetical protein
MTLSHQVIQVNFKNLLKLDLQFGCKELIFCEESYSDMIGVVSYKI